MRLGLNIGYWGSGPTIDASLVVEADRLGYHSVWVAEAYGSDAVSVLAWLGALTEQIKLGSAVMQMPARTPAMTAMTAATIDQLSGGRMLLGLGLSGPQVVEGWHGVPFGKPIGKTREYVSIVRQVLRREAPLEHQGEHYQIPFSGVGATGLGKPLTLITHPLRSEIPIYLAAIGPKNVALSAEVGDGWLPAFYSPERAGDVFDRQLVAGFARSNDADKRARFDVSPRVSVVVTDDLESGRAVLKPQIALYIGGMGAKRKNFYHELAVRYGYEREADRVQDLYLRGDQRGAIGEVPDALVDELSLVGPPGRIADRLEAWKEAGVDTLQIATTDVGVLRLMAELVL